MVKYKPVVINYLNNYPICLIWKPGSEKWELEPMKAIILDRVKSRPSIKYKHLVKKNEIALKKDDTVHYLLVNAKWEGV